jgi:hypothetical protein
VAAPKPGPTGSHDNGDRVNGSRKNFPRGLDLRSISRISGPFILNHRQKCAAGSINGWQAADIAHTANLIDTPSLGCQHFGCRRTNDRHPFSSARRLSFSIAMPASYDQGSSSPNQVEAAACAAMELRAKRTLTDTEWATMRARLLDFASILRDWDRKATRSRRDTVEVLCPREP